MVKKTKCLIAAVLAMQSFVAFADGVKQWSLKDCIDYALENNIKIKTGRLAVASAAEDVKEAKSSFSPSLSFSTTHQAGYRPFAGSSAAEADKGSYSGDYGLNAGWTVWDGKKRSNSLKQKQIASEQSVLSVDKEANSIQEQILELYVQILYEGESVKVNSRILDISRNNTKRGKEMFRVGSLSKADLSQLQSQEATDEYNLVNARGRLADYKSQMKELLRLDYDADFEVSSSEVSDSTALDAVLSVSDVLGGALANRPEVRSSVLGISSSSLAVSMAKAGYKPTLTLSGGIGTSTMTGSLGGWGSQMKNNFNGSIGVTLSVPIFDNRSAKTAVNKAKIELLQSRLEADDVKNSMALTVQGFWINATTNQQRFKAAQASVQSAEDSYDLLSTQFGVGLKNIVELTNAKTVLMNAQQSRLESKYMTVLYMQLLRFYKGENMNLI